MMRDISRRGMLIYCAHELWVGARVRVDWRGKITSGFVRHHGEREGFFYAGIELLADDESLVLDVLAQQVADLQAKLAC